MSDPKKTDTEQLIKDRPGLFDSYESSVPSEPRKPLRDLKLSPEVEAALAKREGWQKKLQSEQGANKS